MTAGSLDRRYRFERRVAVADGAGNFEGEWEFQFPLAGNRKYLRGGETVMASRLTAKSPVIITVRACINSRLIEPEWRCVDERSGEVFNIREHPQESDGRGYVSFLAEAGVA